MTEHTGTPDLTSAQRFPRFVGVATIGFVVDMGLLTALIELAGWHPYPARAVSFSCAITTTWICHRMWVFTERRTPRKGLEYVRFVAVQITSAMINLGIFVLCLETFPWMVRWPVVAVIVGGLAALLFNFVALGRFVFTYRGRV